VPGWWDAGHPQRAARLRRLQILALSAVIVVVAAVGVAVGRTSVSSPPGVGGSGDGSSGDTAAPSGGGRTGPDVATIASKVDPGVVDIATRLGFMNGAAAGTGIVLGSSGEILTNNHVISGATSIKVTDVGNGRTYTATVVGTDKADDIAVLQLAAVSGLRTVTIGDSSSLTVGQAVTAVGNAGGLGGTPSVAAGTVTALDQPITAVDQADNSAEQLTGLVQTDVSLQPGDSGGPLVNTSGDVIGIDTAASSGFQFQSGSSEGFAIPINQAVVIARQMMAGISSAKVHIGPAAFLGVEVRSGGQTPGAVVVGIEPGSPADRAGMVNGDVIVSLGRQPVDSPTALTNLMQRHHPGDRVTVAWVDSSGQQLSAPVQLATGPAG
jgi:S1-C subfamily serine protease